MPKGLQSKFKVTGPKGSKVVTHDEVDLMVDLGFIKHIGSEMKGRVFFHYYGVV